MADDTKVPNLLDRWIGWLKNQPLIAAVCLIALAAGGLATFTDSITKIRQTFSEQKPPASAPTPTLATAPPVPRVSFREPFSLGENGTFVSEHLVTVRTGYIVSYPHLSAALAASTNGYESARDVVPGDQLKLYRSDCDSLQVTVTSIEWKWPKDIPPEVVMKMGPAGDAMITRRVHGIVSGKCEP